MPVQDSQEFQRLSADALHLLTADGGVGEDALHRLLGTGDVTRWTPGDRKIVLEVVLYLQEAYRDQLRRVGDCAFLHPLRTALLLGRAAGVVGPAPEAVLLALLHDKLEDVRAEVHGEDRFQDLEHWFQVLIKRLKPEDEWYLMERLEVLTRREGEPYTAYLGRVLAHSSTMPHLITVKLADRLDNTLDLWPVRARDPLDGLDFFEAAFGSLFLARATLNLGVASSCEPFSISRRLYELYKDIVLLSLLRARTAPPDATAAALFDGLARAGLREAQRVLVLALGRDFADAKEHRRILLETMSYCHAGGIDSVTSPGHHRLDGLFVERFDHADSKLRHTQLERLELDSELRACAAAAFVAMFVGFRQDPHFHVRGVVSGVPVASGSTERNATG